VSPAQLRTYRRQARKQLAVWSARCFSRISARELASALHAMRVGPSGVLLVHTSLSKCGYFVGGPDAVLDAMRAACATLCLPTHTYCYPDGSADVAPLFDAATTPSKNGVLTEMFRRRRESTRSIHSTHSLAAAGPLADHICKDHYLNDTPCGSGTPYARLLSLRASVLLFGVDFHSYTLYHTAEDASGSDCAYEPATRDRLRVVDGSGVERECVSRRQSRTPRRFREAGVLLERAGLVHRLELGRGSLLFVPDCSKVHDYLVERLRTTPDFLYQTCAASLS
jgi:aminoglycoside 3-N-acetyltransferase